MKLLMSTFEVFNKIITCFWRPGLYTFPTAALSVITDIFRMRFLLKCIFHYFKVALVTELLHAQLTDTNTRLWNLLSIIFIIDY